MAKELKRKNVFEKLNTNAKREFKLINKKHLKVPTELYQRDESDGKVSRDIAMSFDWVAFGALTVIERKDGVLHVADGGTRLSAVLLRPDIGNVPCMVFSGLSDQEACDTFLRINLNRRKLTTPQQQHGELFAGHDLAKRTDEALKFLEQNQVGFDSLAIMRSSLKTQPKATDTINKLAPEFARQRHVTGRVYKATVKLESLLNKGNDSLSRYLKRLQNHFGDLDKMLCIAIPARGPGRNNANTNAETVARVLKIKIPKGDKS